MKFKCPRCSKVFTRKMRTRFEKSFLTKAGKLRSTCFYDGRVKVLCKQVVK